MVGLLAVWAVTAYLLAPWAWKAYFRYHRALEDVQRLTHTADGHPGDPLNIGVVGTEAQIVSAMVGRRLVSGRSHYVPQ